jgi:putative membrane protein
MKTAAVVGLLGGLLLVLLLVAHYGTADIVGAMAAVGWLGFPAICALHLSVMALTGLGWWALLPRAASQWVFIGARFVRDSASEILPLSQFGGYLLGARAATLHGIPGSQAIASTIVDVTLEAVAQIAYTGLGLALLLRLRPDDQLVAPITAGLIAMAALMGGFVTVQRRGLAPLWRWLGPLAGTWMVGNRAAGEIRAALLRIHGDRAALTLSATLHLLGWIATSLEAWIALRLMGASLGPAPVLAIESLLYAARSVAFVVPNAIGVQEGAYVVLGGLFGLSPEAALALSLLKRGRDLAIGVPVLLAWQLREGRRWWKAMPQPAPADAATDVANADVAAATENRRFR